MLASINTFDSSFAKKKQLISFPPDFEPVKCKPQLFDLALRDLEFPSLEARKKSTKGGFWSFFSR
jgi:signal recognition particle subunit SRP68